MMVIQVSAIHLTFLRRLLLDDIKPGDIAVVIILVELKIIAGAVDKRGHFDVKVGGLQDTTDRAEREELYTESVEQEPYGGAT